MNNFNFLGLPSLAAEEVLKVMDLRSLFFMSTLSKETKKIVNNSTRNQALGLDITKLHYPHVYEVKMKNQQKNLGLQMLKPENNVNTFNISLEGEIFPARDINGIDLGIFFPSRITGLKVLLEHFSKVFGIKEIFNLHVPSCESVENVIKLQDILKKENMKVGRFSFKTDEMNEEQYKKIMDASIYNVSMLKLVAKNKIVHYKPCIEPVSTIRSITLPNTSTWFHMHHFSLFANCDYFELSFPKLKMNELNQIFQQWKRGERKIRYFKAEVHNMKQDVFLDGLDAKPITRNIQFRDSHRYFANEQKLKIENVNRDDAFIVFHLFEFLFMIY